MIDVVSALINPAISSLLKVGHEKWLVSTELKTLRKVLRERLAREVRFNSEIGQIIGLTENQKISAYDLSVISGIFAQALPLQDLFPHKLDKDMIEKLPISVFNNSHKIRISVDVTEADLIQRIWHRHAIAKIKISNKLNPGDVKYLRGLISVLEINLRTVK